LGGYIIMVRDLRNTPHGLSMNYSIGSPQVIHKKNKNKIKFTTSGKKILL